MLYWYTDTDCQRSAVPALLLALVNMILEGPSVMNKIEQDTMGTNAGTVLSQVLIFNAVKRHRDPQSDATATRHDQNRASITSPPGTTSPR